MVLHKTSKGIILTIIAMTMFESLKDDESGPIYGKPRMI